MSEKSGPVPPQAPHDFGYTPDSIKEITTKAIERTRKLEDDIGALKPEDCTFDTVVLPLALDEAKFDTETDSACFMQSVSTEKLVRDAATEATMKISDFGIESSMRKDIYEALKHAQQNTPRNSLDAESSRLLERMLRDKRRAGLGLPEDKQARFKDLKTQISNKCIEFRKNCDEENGFLLFTKEELAGIPEDVVKGYPQEEDNNVFRHKVTFKTPDVIPLLRYATNSETRRRAYLGYEDRSAGRNTQLFKEIMELRTEAAKVIGYDTWADYIIEPKMAKTAEAAKSFLNDLLEKIKPIGVKERERLLALKKQHCDETGVSYDSNFYAWDYRFYDRLWTERNLQLDDELVKEYLPVEKVVPRMMELYQNLLGVQCFPLTDASTWHEEVTAFAVWDKDALERGAQDGEGFIGYFYLDPYPRANKYGHAACWGLIPGYEQPDGARQYPTSAVVANLAKATDEKPALLSHNDFVTLFHEQGHAWHGLLSKTKYARFHGTAVVRDFVEAPSQMLENWCYEPEVLRYMTSHYKTGKVMPDDLIEKIVKAEAVNQGLFTLRQLYFGLYDLTVHTAKDNIDYTKLWNSLREEVALTTTGNAPLAEGQSSFAHLIGGYDAGYYGYLWSQSFSADMYATVFKKNPLSAEQGKLYRKEILQPGGSREEMDSLKGFLGGRAPNSDAFMKKLLRGAEAL